MVTLRRTVVVSNPQGFHMRPAAAFVERAKQYQSDVRIIKDDLAVDGKSVFELLTLAALPGTELVIEVSGVDADDAVLSSLADIVNLVVDDPDVMPPPANGI
jgi:phosphotransferase system HPr (HPr) family protein